MATTVGNPWAAVRDAVEEAAQDETLSADARIAKLKFYADDLNDLLGRTATYIGGLELVREGRSTAYAERVMEAREDASLREVLLERGLADGETLDLLGYLSHDDLDKLGEEHLLEGWLGTRDELRAADIQELSLGADIQRIWDQAKHPRGAHGRWTDVLGRDLTPKGRRGANVPRLPSAPGGAGGYAVHDDHKHNAFVGKQSELGKFEEKRPERSTGAEVILSKNHDTQEKFSWLEPEEPQGQQVPETAASRARKAAGAKAEVPKAGPASPPTPQAPEIPYEAPPGLRRVYSDERKAMHDQAVALLFKQRKMVIDDHGQVTWELDPQGKPIQVPTGERVMVFLAGGTASGKSVSRNDPRISGAIPHPQDSVTIDPDELKRLFPEYGAITGLGDESAAAALHEESSDLAKRILKEAAARGVHIVMDGTGDSKPGNFPRKIKKAVDFAKEQGHTYDTKVLYFDAPVDVALDREAKRAEKTGRKVHEHTVRAIHAGVSANFPEVQALHEQGVIDHLAVHDTTDGPHLISGEVGPEVPRASGASREREPAVVAAKVEAQMARRRGDAVDVKGDVALAAKLLGEGKRVELSQPREVSTLLTELSRVVQEAEKKGEKAPTFDLCKVSVRGSNLFCAHSKGIKRVEMPQLKGTPIPGSRADRELPKNEKGRVSLDDAWRDHLKSLGVKTQVGTEKASYLRATQSELNGANAARLARAMSEGRETLPIYVSRDNYILDGHHQWAGTIGVDSEDGKLDRDMPIERIDMPITELLDEANRFTKAWGLKQQSLSMK